MKIFLKIDRILSKSNYIDNSEKVFESIKKEKIVFVGGFERSGTGLMRSILDSHPKIKCGPELKLVQDYLNMLGRWKDNKKGQSVMKTAGMSPNLINDVSRQFIYNVINLHHKDNTQRLCHKDPHVMLHIKYANTLFPNARFVLMMRDPRGSISSYLPRYGYEINPHNFEEKIIYWNDLSSIMYSQCREVGNEICMIVRYEDLITKPKKEIERILNFLNEEWSDNVLKHHELIGTEIEVSKKEWSTEDIVKPINSLSLYPWLEFKFDCNGFVEKHAKKLFYSLKYNLTVPAHKTIDKLTQLNDESVKNNASYYKEILKKI